MKKVSNTKAFCEEMQQEKNLRVRRETMEVVGNGDCDCGRRGVLMVRFVAETPQGLAKLQTCCDRSAHAHSLKQRAEIVEQTLMPLSEYLEER